MAFDAGMLSAIVWELKEKIIGARVDKIYQPAKEELVFLLRAEGLRENLRLLISAGANTPRINLTTLELQNPAVPPTFTQLLRKHLQNARILSVEQIGFERVCKIEFEARDDMSFKTTKTLMVEIMGKYSNIIFCDSSNKIISAIKPVDLTTSSKRQVLCGMQYELPPAQDKLTVFEETKEGFVSAFNSWMGDGAKFITSRYLGISALIGREIAYGCNGDVEGFYTNFKAFRELLENKKFTPTLLCDEKGEPFEYSFTPIRQYGSSVKIVTLSSFGELIDRYFYEKERNERVKQKAGDLLRLLDNSIARLKRKNELQKKDLLECAEKDKYRRYGDLITSNIYMIKKGMATADLVDYYDEAMPTVKVPLDIRMNPQDNAQKYYKKYNKLKTAEKELTKQLEISARELVYLESVLESFGRAAGELEINEIRRELYESGYGSKLKKQAGGKPPATKPLEFCTTGGYRVLCGKNNTQNDRITHKLASAGDFWFHAKNMPGSHVVMFCDGMEEPPAEDFTQAAMIAAYYSAAGGSAGTEVDYTLVRNLKKPAGSKPGFVIYHTNYSAFVTPDKALIESLKV